MPCPFPGMDPYLEIQPYWGDFAPTLLAAIRNNLLPGLLPKYDARIEEPHKHRRLAVIHQDSGRVVTVMELLSASNKTPGEDGLESYMAKRGELLASESHLIELDLLRGGQRLPMAQDLPPADYYAFVGRREDRPHCQVIAWTLPARLPEIPVPLMAEDPDAMLDLEAAFRAAYEPSLYERRLPYDRPLSPRLAPEMEEWVNRQLEAVRPS